MLLFAELIHHLLFVFCRRLPTLPHAALSFGFSCTPLNNTAPNQLKALRQDQPSTNRIKSPAKHTWLNGRRVPTLVQLVETPVLRHDPPTHALWKHSCFFHAYVVDAFDHIFFKPISILHTRPHTKVMICIAFVWVFLCVRIPRTVYGRHNTTRPFPSLTSSTLPSCTAREACCAA